MNRLKGSGVWILVFGFLSANVILIPSSNAFDSTPPKMESCSVTPRVISDSAGGTVKVTIKVQSNNGLSTRVRSALYSKDGEGRSLGGFLMNLQSGDEFSGTWVQEIAVKPGLKPGLYYLSVFPLEDKVQNTTQFLKCDGQDLAYGVTEPASTPTPAPKPTNSKIAQPPVSQESYDALISINTQLRSQNAKLLSQIQSLTIIANKYNKICATKPKPKGC